MCRLINRQYLQLVRGETKSAKNISFCMISIQDTRTHQLILSILNIQADNSQSEISIHHKYANVDKRVSATFFQHINLFTYLLFYGNLFTY